MGNLKNFFIWIAIIAAVFLGVNMFDAVSSGKNDALIPYSTFLQDVDGKKVDRVCISGNSVRGLYKDGKMFSTYTPNDNNLVNKFFLIFHFSFLFQMFDNSFQYLYSLNIISLFLNYQTTYRQNQKEIIKIFFLHHS